MTDNKYVTKNLQYANSETDPDLVLKTVQEFRKAKTFSNLQKLMVSFLTNQIYLPGELTYFSTTGDEYDEVRGKSNIDNLILMNKKGLVTFNSQTGKKQSTGSGFGPAQKSLSLNSGLVYMEREFVTGMCTRKTGQMLHEKLSVLDGVVVLYGPVSKANNLSLTGTCGIPTNVILNIGTGQVDSGLRTLAQYGVVYDFLQTWNILAPNRDFFNEFVKTDKYCEIHIVDTAWGRKTLFNNIVVALSKYSSRRH